MNASFLNIARRTDILLTFVCCLFLAGVVHAWSASAPQPQLDERGTVLVSALLYSSDARLMDTIQPLEGGRAKLSRLSPVAFTWKSGPLQGHDDIGFIAQDVEKVIPEVVTSNADGMKFVDYPKLVPLLVRAIQENQAEIDTLKASVAERRMAIEAVERELPGI